MVAYGLHLLQDNPFNAFGARWCRHRAFIVPVIVEFDFPEEILDLDLFRELPIIFFVMINSFEDGRDEGAFFITTAIISSRPIEEHCDHGAHCWEGRVSICRYLSLM